MFRQVRYQTGELQDILKDMKKGIIPCMDVDDNDELEWFINQLTKHGIFKVSGLPYNKDARNRVNEPEFEFRIGFYNKPVDANDLKDSDLMYIDFYFEPDIEETYDPVGEM
jgi:hypothetical protein